MKAGVRGVHDSAVNCSGHHLDYCTVLYSKRAVKMTDFTDSTESCKLINLLVFEDRSNFSTVTKVH